MTVSGLGFGRSAAEVRWNGSDGELLASASGPDFSSEVAIPSAPGGLYNLVVVSRNPDGSIGDTGSASFLVTGQGLPAFGLSRDPGAKVPSGAAAVGASPDAPNRPKRLGPIELPTAAGSIVLVGIALVALGAIIGASVTKRKPKDT